ncbi:MAG: hypothetical protein FJ037_04185 [Chloroflexi bacterium]|nr:hypothetical protein [Chloroflexota bacterium]
MRNTAGRFAMLAGFAMALAVVAACGSDKDETFDINKGGSDADVAVNGFMDGWAQASGPTPDQFEAGQTRRFLGGDLGAMVANIRTGGTAGQKPVEQVFNDIMKTPLPPDLGYDVIESAKQGDAGAVVKIKLKYSVESVNNMVKAGKIQPEDAAKAFDEVKVGPVRTLTLARGEGGWQITKVEG